MTPKEFFTAVKIPESWRYLGANNALNGDEVTSYGLIFSIGDNRKMKLFYQPEPNERGGLVEKTPGVYNLLIYNKTPEEINEYINEFYNDNPSK